MCYSSSGITPVAPILVRLQLDMRDSCAHKHVDTRHLGADPSDGRYADVSLETCTDCGQLWVRYQFEFEAFTGSGRWYRGEIDADQASRLEATNAAKLLESLPSYTAGGSYFSGRVHQRSGRLV